jgi:putative DNA primase/helicase
MADGSAPINSKFYPIEDAYNGALDGKIDELLDEKREVYFGCATFKDPRGQRTAKNAAGYKCFRADIDCGPGKPYPTKKDGLLALQKYLEEVGLPMPTLVDSGRGWHLYWTLDEVIDYNTWRPMADALKKSMADLEFGADPSVTADGARILRIPGTFNHKDATKP